MSERVGDRVSGYGFPKLTVKEACESVSTSRTFFALHCQSHTQILRDCGLALAAFLVD